MYKLMVLMIAMLAGCTQASGVLKLGPDTYTTSAAAAPAAGGPSAARRIALTEANEYCAKLGKEILVSNIGSSTTNLYGAGKAEITFHCYDKGDPQLYRPEFQRAPDVIIEDRRR